MPPEAAFTIGLMLGVTGLLLIQAFARRKVRQALRVVDPDVVLQGTIRREEDERRIAEVDAMRQRLTVLERIAIEPAMRTAREIDALR